MIKRASLILCALVVFYLGIRVRQWTWDECAAMRFVEPPPMPKINVAAELFSTIAVFLLIRFWVSISPATSLVAAVQRLSSSMRPATIALMGASLFWLNPAIIISAEGWGRRDVWVMPFFLFAVLFASTGRTFLAGLLLGLGAIVESRILLGGATLLLLPLFRRDGKSFAKILTGLVIALALCSVPRLMHFRVDPLSLQVNGDASHGEYLTAGQCPNVAWLLTRYYHWNNAKDLYAPAFTIDHQFTLSWAGDVFFDHRLHVAVPLRTVLFVLFLVSVVACAFAAAAHYRRADPRFLVAVVAPWLMMFTLLLQMQERYLIWTAAMSAIFVAVDWGMVLIHIYLSIISAGIIWMRMCETSRFHLDSPLYQNVSKTFSGVPWATVLLAGVVFFVAVTPRRQRTV